MEREIVSLHIGQTGIQLADPLWKVFCIDHGIPFENQSKELHYSLDSKDEIFKNFFHEHSEKKYEPRSIFADFGNGDLANPSSIFDPASLVQETHSTEGNFAKARSFGIEKIKDQIRRTTENCDDLQGFLFYHSTAGGTGSGLANSLLEQTLNDEFPGKKRVVFSLFPPPPSSPTSPYSDPGRILAPYNHLMSMNSLINSSECTFCYDNAALHRIYHKVIDDYKIPVGFPELNELWAYNIGSITATLRMESFLNSSLAEIVSNHVAFPSLQFLFSYSSPYRDCWRSCQQAMSCAEINEWMFFYWKRSLFFSLVVPPSNGLYLQLSLLYRGYLTARDINPEIEKIRQAKTAFHFSTIVNNYFRAHLLPESCRNRISWESHFQRESTEGCAIINNTCMVENFAQFKSQISELFAERKFFHYYQQEGMEEMEIEDAIENLTRVIDDYNDVNTFSMEDEEELAAEAEVIAATAENTTEGDFI
jgi:tubulin alpha